MRGQPHPVGHNYILLSSLESVAGEEIEHKRVESLGLFQADHVGYVREVRSFHVRELLGEEIGGSDIPGVKSLDCDRTATATDNVRPNRPPANNGVQRCTGARSLIASAVMQNAPHTISSKSIGATGA